MELIIYATSFYAVNWKLYLPQSQNCIKTTSMKNY